MGSVDQKAPSEEIDGLCSLGANNGSPIRELGATAEAVDETVLRVETEGRRSVALILWF